MLITLLATVVMILVNEIRTIGQFTAFCAFQLFIWILVKQILW